MRDGPHQWPSGAATRKYVDRVTDRLAVRCDRQTEKIRGLQADLILLKRRFDNIIPLFSDDDQQG